MPSWDNFYRFFGAADEKANIAAYRRFLRDKIDAETRRYWEGRGGFLRRKRITLFSRDLYHHGLLGYFIGAAHFMARLYGADPKAMMAAKSLDEQRSIYEAALAPLFDKRLVRWATTKRLALFGLGIPPAQYEALASAGGGDIAPVLKQRLERLACGFSIADNYFAWQAFSRSYADDLAGPLPPYLRREHFASMRARADRGSAAAPGATSSPPPASTRTRASSGSTFRPRCWPARAPICGGRGWSIGWRSAAPTPRHSIPSGLSGARISTAPSSPTASP
jgi:S-adenosylmethionine-diacylglycerol 3-amino-3-carboxypropyl transferase